MSKEVARVQRNLTINNQTFPAVATEQTKGRSVGAPIVVLEFPVTDAALFDRFRSAIGVEKFLGAVFREVIRPACLEASAVATDEKSGKIEDGAKYLAALEDYFNPESRRSTGPTKKELVEKQLALFNEAKPLWVKFQKGTITDGEKLALARITADIEDLGAKIDKRSAKAKKAEVAAEATPAAEPAN